MGIFTGVAMKRLGNDAAAFLGTAFLCLQGLSYYGYIQIDYEKVANDAVKIVDADGNGKLTVDDAKILWDRFKRMVTYNVPGTGGFSMGLLLGIRFGR